MPTSFGDFDFVLQITAPALNRVYQAMHVAGLFGHQFAHTYKGRFVTLSFPPPTVTLEPQLDSFGRLQVALSARLLYASRRAADAGDPGDFAAVDANMAIRISLTNAGDPTPLNGCYLAVDWSATQANAFQTAPGATASAADVSAALLDFIASQTGWLYPLPVLGFGSSSIANASIAFLPSSQGGYVTIGLNAAAAKGSRGQLTSAFATNDWAVGVSANFLNAQIASSLGTALSGLPAPHGSARPVLSDQTVCVVNNPSPFGPACLDSADQKVYLDSLDWSFGEGKITFTGSFTPETDSMFVPSVHANFSFDAFASVASDGTVTMTFSQPAVQLTDWYASLVNTLTGGAITNAIAGTISSTLTSVNGSAGTGLISTATLQQFTSLGSIVHLPISADFQSIEIHSYGMLVQGTLNPGPVSGAPVANFDVLPSNAGPSTPLFTAQRAWCPGHRPVTYAWNFGDGATASFSGDSAHHVTTHAYALPGSYQACVTITDETGASTRSCQTVNPGAFTVARLGDSDAYSSTWELCKSGAPHDIVFKISCINAPVTGATVTLSAGAWRQTGVTGRDGAVRFTGVAEGNFDVSLADPSNFELGGVHVQVTKPGFPTLTAVLYLKDCAAAAVSHNLRQNLGQAASNLPQQILNPLVPVMNEAVLAGFGDGGDGPWESLVSDTTIVAQTLMQLVKLTAKTNDVALAAEALRLPAGSSRTAVLTALEGLTKTMSASLQKRAAAVGNEARARIRQAKGQH